MSDTKQCAFVFDPESDHDQKTDSPLSDVWECPHERYDDYAFCPYHLPKEQRDEAGLTPTTFRERFIEDIAAAGQTTKEFIGADLTGLDLRYATVTSTDEYPINLAHATIDGTLDLTSASLTQPLFLGSASIERLEARDSTLDGSVYLINSHLGEIDISNAELDSLNMQGAAVQGETIARDASIDSGVNCQRTVFVGYTRMEGLSCGAYASFRGASFQREADFDGAVVDALDLRDVVATRLDLRKLDVQKNLLMQDADIEVLDIGQTDLGGKLSLKRGHIEGATELRGISVERLDISQTSFGSVVHLGRSEVSTEIVGRNCEVQGLFDGSYADFGRVTFTGAQFEGAVQFRHCQFLNTTTFGGARFASSIDCTDADFHDSVTFVRTTFSEQVTFKNCSMHDWVEIRPHLATTPLGIQFDHATVTGGEIYCQDGIVYDFTRATLGDVVFESAEVSETCFDHLRIFNTKFDGFEFGQYKKQLRDVGWGLHTVEPSVAEDEVGESLGLLENTYLKAKNGAKVVGDNKAAAEFFRKEMAYRRKQHAAVAKSATDSPKARLVSTGRWIANGTLSLTTGYGERPSRVLAASISIILTFSLIYAGVLNLPTTTGSYGEQYILFSLQSFVTFIVGSPANESVRQLVQFLSAVQGFLGAFFVALFVFTLTRSIHR